MDTTVIVALIGGGVTLAGFLISGIFGLLASTSQREGVANAGVERALNERIVHKDELVAECRRELAECDESRADIQKQLDEANLEVWELKGNLHALEVENRVLRGEVHEQ
jgi:chromosome segregation ATPase